MSDNQRALVAGLLIAAIILVYYGVIAPRFLPAQSDGRPSEAAQAERIVDERAPSAPAAAVASDRDAPRAEDAPRIPIETGSITGSISLRGARIDDLHLTGYRETLDPNSPTVTLLRPRRERNAFFALFGWTSADLDLRESLPGPRTEWRVISGESLSANAPVTLQAETDDGIRITRTISVDDDYMFTITDRVENQTGETVALNPYGFVQRYGMPERNGMIGPLFTGPLGVFDGALTQRKYKKVIKDGPFAMTAQDGWLGITDKYWLAAVIPAGAGAFDASFQDLGEEGAPVFRAEYVANALELAPGQATEITQRLFAGAKRKVLLDRYERELEVANFDQAIDWGHLFPLTRTFFFLLQKSESLVGNFGLAILIVTLMVRAVFFPLAHKSFESMAKMRKVQPEMQKLQERFKDDRMKMQQELMALYKKEKVNPLAGCLLILPQIPVFFAFYKVLFVTIEMRHAPFFGWIRDLSAPDPTAWVNLFGLLPFSVDAMTSIPLVGQVFAIGAWPMIMGVTMWLQQSLNPPPTDPMQQRIFAILPFMFTIILAGFSAGLVIYWTWTNALTILQQYVIMRRMGVKPQIFSNIPLLKRLKPNQE